MKIKEAYCEELNRVVDIYEAQEEYFALPENGRQKFTFRCSDEVCRKQNNPLIVGVNYYLDTVKAEEHNELHFKSNAYHPHIIDCRWIKQSSFIESMQGRRDSNERVEVNDVNIQMVEVFNPPDQDVLTNDSKESSQAKSYKVVDEQAHVKSNGGSPRSLTATKRLDPLVEKWSQLKKDLRKQTYIRVASESLTYAQLFCKVEYMKPYYNGKRVVFGGAKVINSVDAGGNHYCISFYDECVNFPEFNGARSLSIMLPVDRLKVARRGGLISSQIKKAKTEGYYLKVFAWAEIIPLSDRGGGYELEIKSLNCLVLQVIKTKSFGRLNRKD